MSVKRRLRFAWASHVAPLITRYVPEVSALAANPDVPTEVDAETKDLLKSLGMDSLPVNVTNVTSFVPRERKGRYIPGAGRA